MHSPTPLPELYYTLLCANTHIKPRPPCPEPTVVGGSSLWARWAWLISSQLNQICVWWDVQPYSTLSTSLIKSRSSVPRYCFYTMVNLLLQDNHLFGYFKRLQLHDCLLCTTFFADVAVWIINHKCVVIFVLQ